MKMQVRDSRFKIQWTFKNKPTVFKEAGLRLRKIHSKGMSQNYLREHSIESPRIRPAGAASTIFSFFLVFEGWERHFVSIYFSTWWMEILEVPRWVSGSLGK
jgi:hypothetical protein